MLSLLDYNLLPSDSSTGEGVGRDNQALCSNVFLFTQPNVLTSVTSNILSKQREDSGHGVDEYHYDNVEYNYNSGL